MHRNHLGDRADLASLRVLVAYAEMVKETKEVADLDKDIRELELELARLRSKYPLEDVSPPPPLICTLMPRAHPALITAPVSQRITTEQAEEVLDNQIVDMQNLEEEKKAVSSQVDEVREELARTAKEVQRMGRERDREEARAKEAREGAEKGDQSVDELCRWLVGKKHAEIHLPAELKGHIYRYTSAISVYKGLNGIKSMQPLSEIDILLEYTLAPGSRGREELTDGADAVKVVLSYDPQTKTLARAKVSLCVPMMTKMSDSH